MGASDNSWGRVGSDGELGCQQDQEEQEGSPGGKTKPTRRQDARDPKKAAYPRCETRQNKQPTYSWEKLLLVKVFIPENSSELKWWTCTGRSAEIYLKMGLSDAIRKIRAAVMLNSKKNELPKNYYY